MKKTLSLMTFLALAALMIGCIEYEEELWLNYDGSGRAALKISLESSASQTGDSGGPSMNEDELLAKFRAVPGISVIHSESGREDDIEWVVVELAFDSVGALSRVNLEGDEVDFIGEIALRRDESRNLVFTRTVRAGEGESEANTAMIAGMFKGFSWTYTAHFPGKIIESNASEENTDLETGMVKWKYSLAGLARGPQTMKVVFTAPCVFSTGDFLRWLAQLAVIAAAIVIVALVLVKLFRGKKKRN